MRYRLLGRSGLRVSELCLGTMTFGNEWGWGADALESHRIFNAYCEAGGNFIDTANRYTEGTAEKLVGEFVRPDRDHFVVATKYTLFDRKADPNFSGNHRKNLVRSLEMSLKRLGLDGVDLLWLHAWDFTTAVEEVMRALDDVVRAGKALHVGVSDTPAWIVSQANTLAALRGLTPFVALQIQWSLVERTPERDLVPMARAFELAVTPWGALGSGVLSGKYNEGKGEGGRAGLRGAIAEQRLRIAEVVRGLAGEIGHTPSQVALAWLRQQPGNVIPILGARRTDQIRDNLGCLDLALSEAQLQRLCEASRIELGFPHDFLALPPIRDLAYGGTYDSIDRRS